jgi:hypothetical protein
MLGKDINLVSLHRKKKQWIKQLYHSLSRESNSHSLWISHLPRWDNQTTKQMAEKFSTYPRPIILFISIFLKERKKENIIM